MKRRQFRYVVALILFLLFRVITVILWPEWEINHFWNVVAILLFLKVAGLIHIVFIGVIPQKFLHHNGIFTMEVVIRGKTYGINGTILNIDEKEDDLNIDRTHFHIAFNNGFIAKELKRKIADQDYTIVKTIRHGSKKWKIRIDTIVGYDWIY